MYIEIEICHKLLWHSDDMLHNGRGAICRLTYTGPAKLSGIEQARMLDFASSWNFWRWSAIATWKITLVRETFPILHLQKEQQKVGSGLHSDRQCFRCCSPAPGPWRAERINPILPPIESWTKLIVVEQKVLLIVAKSQLLLFVMLLSSSSMFWQSTRIFKYACGKTIRKRKFMSIPKPPFHIQNQKVYRFSSPFGLWPTVLAQGCRLRRLPL